MPTTPSSMSSSQAYHSFSWFLLISADALWAAVIAYLAWFQGLAQVNGSAAASTLFIQPPFFQRPPQAARKGYLNSYLKTFIEHI